MNDNPLWVWWNYLGGRWRYKGRVRFWQFIAWKLLPRPLIYYAAIRLVAWATTRDPLQNTPVPEVRALDAIEQWELTLRMRDR